MLSMLSLLHESVYLLANLTRARTHRDRDTLAHKPIYIRP
jgi:hypothetical protein